MTAFAFIGQSLTVVKLFLNPNSELCNSLDLDGHDSWYLWFVFTKSSRNSQILFLKFSAKGTILKKLSMVIKRPVKM